MVKGFFCKAIWPLVKKALLQAAAIIGAVATVMGVIGFSLADLCGENFNCQGRLILVAVAFAFLTAVAAATSYLRSRDGLNLVIGENEVEVVVGDIFTCDGVRVIPFDEYYDIQVDDKVISRNSLNGIFIERYADWETLQQTIAEVQPSFAGAPEAVDGRIRYPLGTVKAYDDYALLAFTHMDEAYCARLGRGQYENCLRNMWADLNRIYAGRRVVLPLLGSGITRFEGGRPSEDDLLRCMLCTLRASGQHFKDGVLIVLTKKSAQRMRLYEVEDYARAWKQGIGEKDGL